MTGAGLVLVRHGRTGHMQSDWIDHKAFSAWHFLPPRRGSAIESSPSGHTMG